MEGIHRQLLQEAAKGDVVGPFFGFMGAAAALIFACKVLRCSTKPRSDRSGSSCAKCTKYPAQYVVAGHEMTPRSLSIYDFF